MAAALKIADLSLRATVGGSQIVVLDHVDLGLAARRSARRRRRVWQWQEPLWYAP